jgi:hypothetical protein
VESTEWLDIYMIESRTEIKRKFPTFSVWINTAVYSTDICSCWHYNIRRQHRWIFHEEITISYLWKLYKLFYFINILLSRVIEYQYSQNGKYCLIMTYNDSSDFYFSLLETWQGNSFTNGLFYLTLVRYFRQNLLT